MVQTINERMENLMDRFERQQLKIYDDLISKLSANHQKYIDRCDTHIEDWKEKITETCRVIKQMAGNLNRDIVKRDLNQVTKLNKFRQPQSMVIDPKTFLPEFIHSGRYDFINHFLEAKFGSKYRGDRFQNVWKFDGYEYIKTEFEPIVDEMYDFEDEKILVTCDGPGGRVFFDNNQRWFSHKDCDVDLTRENLRTFLIYMHNKLPNIRN